MADRVHVAGLLGGGWRSLDFSPFRTGIEIAWLHKGVPGIAVLRYDPDAKAPLHLHPDVELIVVLDGTQRDENGTYGPGDVVINPKGSRHSVWSEKGCVVLLHWSKPVVFLDAE